MKKTILAVAYYRMSDAKQEMSIADQRKAVQAYAKAHGYTILREYLDEAISGDATEKRHGFQKMIADAERGEFVAILCWDQDRFGRFDSIEAGRWVYPLRQAGIHLATVSQGVIDWHSFTGRVMYSIQTEAKHQYLTDLSRNVSRGMDNMATAGKWPSGKPPHGYALNSERHIILGRQEDIEFVRWVFNSFLEGKSLRMMSIECMKRGNLSWMGKPWSSTALANILKHTAYTGEMIWNKRCMSKYKKPGRTSIWNDPSEWIVFPNNHPAIIDRAMFDRVQEQLKVRTKWSTPLVASGGFMFTGLLRCAQCGGPLVGGTLGKKVRSLTYSCHNHAKLGSAFCGLNRVRQADVVAAVIPHLERVIFNPSTMEAIAAECRRQLTPAGSQVNVAAIHKEIAEVDAKLKKSKARLLEVASDMLQDLQEQIRALKAARERQVKRLEELTTKRASEADVELRVQDALRRFASIKAAIERGEPTIVRQFMSEIVDHIKIETHQVHFRGKRMRSALAGGEIVARGINLSSDAHNALQLLRIRFTASAA